MIGVLEMYTGTVQGKNLRERLNAIPEIVSVEAGCDSIYGEYFRCFIWQPYDHNHPEKGNFRQQFCLLHRSDSAAVVFVTSGGTIDSLYWTEAATLLKANQVILETRYCGRSRPDSTIDWHTLTLPQIAADLHAVIKSLETALYSSNYRVSTGNGQGGLEALFHKRYYPEDVRQTILFNTPLCSDSPDKRVGRYQVRLGKPNKMFRGGGIQMGMNGGGFSFFPTGSELNFDIKDFQRYCFRHLDSLLPLFEAYSREHRLDFRRVGSSLRALQLTILEYRPAFFYGAVSKELIPDKEYDNPAFYFEHLITVSDPARFCDSTLYAREPMSWLALNETGSYTHFVRPYREWVPKDIHDRSFLYASDMPWKNVTFRQEQTKDMKRWLRNEAKDILFIYGLLDIFAAAKVNLKKNDYCTLLVSPGQGLVVRIENFDWGTCNYLKDMILTNK